MPGLFDLMKMPPLKPGQKFPLFTRISIETISNCNRSCSFCPVAWGDRGKTSMKDELYDKIVNELHDEGFDGVAQMFLLSEPFIDQKMTKRAVQLREACPKATLYASTNADVFDSIYKSRGKKAFLEKLASYFEAGITTINMNVYDDRAQKLRYLKMQREAVEAGICQLGDEKKKSKYARHPASKGFLYVTDMRPEAQDGALVTNQFFIKIVDEAKKVRAPRRHCHRMQRHLTVLYDGTVPLCCAVDVTNKELVTMGDVNVQTMREVWDSEAFYKYRYFTQSGRRELPGCSNCEHKMGGFPHAVRQVKPSSVSQKKQWEEEARIEQKRLDEAAV